MPAAVSFALGEHDQGFESLESGYRNRDHFLCYLKISPWFDGVRSDPRYISLLKKIGLDK